MHCCGESTLLCCQHISHARLTAAGGLTRHSSRLRLTSSARRRALLNADTDLLMKWIAFRLSMWFNSDHKEVDRGNC